MEHATRMIHLHSKGLTNAIICNLAETWYQESKGVAKWPLATHAKDSNALPSSFTKVKVHTLFQCFQKGQPTSCPQEKNDTRLASLNDCHHTKAPTLRLAFRNQQYSFHSPYSAISSTSFDATKSAPFSAQQMPPMLGITQLHQPSWCSGTPLMPSPLPLMTKRTTLNP